MAQVVSTIAGTTMTGLPLSAVFSCCSQDAKKLLRSRTSQRSTRASMGRDKHWTSNFRDSFLGDAVRGSAGDHALTGLGRGFVRQYVSLEDDIGIALVEREDGEKRAALACGVTDPDGADQVWAEG